MLNALAFSITCIIIIIIIHYDIRTIVLMILIWEHPDIFDYMTTQNIQINELKNILII